jgi:hypothetical protein
MFTTTNPKVREAADQVVALVDRRAGEQRHVEDLGEEVQVFAALGDHRFGFTVEPLSDDLALVRVEYPLGGGLRDEEGEHRAVAWCAYRNSKTRWGRYVYEKGLISLQMELFSPGVTEANLRLTMDLLASAQLEVGDMCARTGALPLRDLAALVELENANDFDIDDTD